jgi:sirohydrochlorin ferrochelatase
MTMTKKHLLLIAHGSRRQASNDEVRQLAEQVAAQRGQDIDAVEVAFLELAEPSIPEGLARCVANSATEIVVFPYFLAAGTHVVSDIPEAIEAFRAEHPGVRVRLTPHLGASDALPAAILAVAAT